MPDQERNIIIYRTADGNASVALLAKDGKIWLNQQQMAELFATSKQTISYHIINILKENELTESSVVKEYLTTAADGKSYNIIFYSLEMIIAVGYRVRGVRGIQFRQWATNNHFNTKRKGWTWSSSTHKATTSITYGKCCIEHGMRHVMEHCHNNLIHFLLVSQKKTVTLPPNNYQFHSQLFEHL